MSRPDLSDYARARIRDGWEMEDRRARVAAMEAHRREVARSCSHCGGTGQTWLHFADLAPAYQALLSALALAGPLMGADLPQSTGKAPARAMQLKRLEELGLVERRALTGNKSYQYVLTTDGRQITMGTTP